MMKSGKSAPVMLLAVFAACVATGVAQDKSGSRDSAASNLAPTINQNRLLQTGARPTLAAQKPRPPFTINQHALFSRTRHLAADFNHATPSAATGKSLPTFDLSTTHLLAPAGSHPSFPAQPVSGSSLKLRNASHPDADKLQ